MGEAGASRSEMLQSLLPPGDFLPAFETSFWARVGVPRSTPVEIIDKLIRDINAALADSTIAGIAWRPASATICSRRVLKKAFELTTSAPARSPLRAAWSPTATRRPYLR